MIALRENSEFIVSNLENYYISVDEVLSSLQRLKLFKTLSTVHQAERCEKPLDDNELELFGGE